MGDDPHRSPAPFRAGRALPEALPELARSGAIGRPESTRMSGVEKRNSAGV